MFIELAPVMDLRWKIQEISEMTSFSRYDPYWHFYAHKNLELTWVTSLLLSLSFHPIISRVTWFQPRNRTCALSSNRCVQIILPLLQIMNISWIILQSLIILLECRKMAALSSLSGKKHQEIRGHKCRLVWGNTAEMDNDPKQGSDLAKV